jgi:DHA1 family bicyclomycin/chloramphenicol resistance-like MFS transporter
VRVESMTIGRGRAASLVILGALTTFGPMAIDLYLPAFPDVAVDLGVSVTTVPLTLTTSMIGMGVGQFLYGPLSDRYGRKKPMMVGLILFTVASVACALAPTFGVLLITRFFQSLGGAAGVVIARAIVRDLYQGKELAKALSIVVMVFAFAPIFAPTLGAVLLTFGGWRSLFYFLAIFGIACMAASLQIPETLLPERRTDHGIASAVHVYARIVVDSRFLAPAMLIGFTYVILFSFISTSPAVLIDFFGLGELPFAVLFGFLSFCFALGAPINRRLLNSFSMQQLIRALVGLQLVASMILLWTALITPNLWVVTAAIGLGMFTVGAVSANATALCLDPFPGAAGSAAALVGVFGMAVGAIVSSMLVAISMPVVTELGTAMFFGAVAGALMLPFLSERRRRAKADAAEIS